METLELRATPRKIVGGNRVKALRREDIVPGIIYGHGIDPIPVQFDSLEVEKAISQAGTSSTIQIYVEGVPDPYLAIFRDVQYHVIKRNVIHLDLQALSLKETVRVPVTVTLTGESPAIEEAGGVLLQILNELEIEALPTALVPSIEIDVSVLTEIGQSITVGDIAPPPGVTIHNAPHEIIAQAVYIEEEEEEEEVEVMEPGEVEVIGQGPAEEEGEEEEEEEDQSTW
ncbi:MAG: 50S ribosomal protein L25 [Anaerolineae bacterium]